MNKPNNYDDTKGYSNRSFLPAGCYVCKIMQVKETKSKNGRDMIMISLDIAEGEFKDHFANSYKEDTREDKKWGCVVYQLTEDNDGNTNRGFKSFIDSVKSSNQGWKEVWGDRFAENFKDKLVGGLFGEEEYVKSNGDTGKSTKCRFFDSVKRVRDGKCNTPAPKLLSTGRASSPDGFIACPEGLEEELPF